MERSLSEIFWVFREDEALGTLAHPGEGPYRTGDQARFVAAELARKDDIPRYVVGVAARVVPDWWEF